MEEDRFCFVIEWFDSQACLNRPYQLLFYPTDLSIELFELKTRRHFLKRNKQEGIRLSDLFIGNTVTILSRTMKIVDYGDAYTKRILSTTQQKTVAILTAGHHVKLGQIIDGIYKSGLVISKMRRVQITSRDALHLLESQRDRANFNSCINAIADGPIVVLELMGSNAKDAWTSVIGGSDISCEVDDASLAKIDQHLLVDKKVGTNTAKCVDSTCCVVKPHIVAAGMAGAVIFEIQKAGFDVNAIQTVNFSKPNAEEFLEVYKSVLQEYPEMVEELIGGLSIAIEVGGAADVQRAFRDFVGPHDPEIARTLRPSTLRAQFGLDKIKNAVHCTDLPEDGPLEVEYFFRILDQN